MFGLPQGQFLLNGTCFCVSLYVLHFFNQKLDIFSNIIWQLWKSDSSISPGFVIFVFAVAECFCDFLEIILCYV